MHALCNVLYAYCECSDNQFYALFVPVLVDE